MALGLTGAMITTIIVVVVLAALVLVGVIVVNSRTDPMPVPRVTDTGTPTSLAPSSAAQLPDAPFTSFPTTPPSVPVPVPIPLPTTPR